MRARLSVRRRMLLVLRLGLQLVCPPVTPCSPTYFEALANHLGNDGHSHLLRNEQFVVDKDIIKSGVLVGSMLEDFGDSDEPLQLYNVSSSVLKKILEYCEYHRGDPQPTDIAEWNRKFMTANQGMLFEIIRAANFLDIGPLQDLGCKTVADIAKGKTPEEIMTTFNVVNRGNGRFPGRD